MENNKKEKRDTKKSFKENFVNFFGEKNEKEAYNNLNYYSSTSYIKVNSVDYSKNFLNLLQKNNIKISIISNKEKILLLKK